MVDTAVDTTCTEAGKTEGKHCSVCNAIITAQEEIPALGHDFTDDYLNDAGGHWYKCTRCDATATKRSPIPGVTSSNTVLREVGVLNGAIVVTVSGDKADYSFTVGEDNKTYTTPNRLRAMFWNDSEYAALTSHNDLIQNAERANAFAANDTVKLRIFISNALNVDATVWSVTLTPTSAKTYTVPTPTD